jgi:hypothetical protein
LFRDPYKTVALFGRNPDFLSDIPGGTALPFVFVMFFVVKQWRREKIPVNLGVFESDN